MLIGVRSQRRRALRRFIRHDVGDSAGTLPNLDIVHHGNSAGFFNCPLIVLKDVYNRRPLNAAIPANNVHFVLAHSVPNRKGGSA